MLVWKFSFAPIETKIKLFKSQCYPIYGCAFRRHSFQNSIRKFTVSYRDTFKCLINVPRDTSSSLAFAMNATDHIHVVFCKFAYSLMSRVINLFPQQYCHCHFQQRCISLVSTDDKCEVCYMNRIDHRQDYPSICQCVMNDLVDSQYRQHITSVPKLFSIFHIHFRLSCLYL